MPGPLNRIDNHSPVARKGTPVHASIYTAFQGRIYRTEVQVKYWFETSIVHLISLRATNKNLAFD